MYHLNDEQKTLKIYLEAVKNAYYLLQYIPYEKRTSDICLEVVKQKASLINEFPLESITYEICAIAVKSDISLLKYINNLDYIINLCREFLTYEEVITHANETIREQFQQLPYMNIYGVNRKSAANY
jgi:hypothetical protein